LRSVDLVYFFDGTTAERKPPWNRPFSPPQSMNALRPPAVPVIPIAFRGLRASFRAISTVQPSFHTAVVIVAGRRLQPLAASFHSSAPRKRLGDVLPIFRTPPSDLPQKLDGGPVKSRSNSPLIRQLILKIRVSVVRFRPWAPHHSFKSLFQMIFICGETIQLLRGIAPLPLPPARRRPPPAFLAAVGLLSGLR
jgi:hypothetical protein